jgi:hypothetical protein
MMKKIKYAALLAAVLLLCALQAAMADMPRTLSYQGVLKDADGLTVVPDGDYELTFRIYDVASGGSSLWSEMQVLTVTQGVFSAILGSVTPLEIPFDTAYWLGVSVSGDIELVPRLELAASAYSMRAAFAESANVEFPPVVGMVPIGAVVAWLPNFGSTPNLPPEFVKCNGSMIEDPESPFFGVMSPNLNEGSRFLWGNIQSGLVGGSTSHGHSVTVPAAFFGAVPPGPCALPGTFNTTAANHVPPYYTVVWVMRIK